MSHDLDVILRREPPADAFARFADGRDDVVWEGSLGSVDNLVVSPAANPNKSSFLVYDCRADDATRRDYGSLLPGLAYTVVLAVPFGTDRAGHELAFSFGNWLADQFDGIVYAPDLDEIVWPESRRGERAEFPDDPDLV